MDFIKNNYEKIPFPIVKFFEHIEIQDEEAAKRLFKDTIQEIIDFDKIQKSLREFAGRIKRDQFKILQSDDVKRYWAETQIKLNADMLELNRQQFLISRANKRTLSLMEEEEKEEEKDENKTEDKNATKMRRCSEGRSVEDEMVEDMTIKKISSQEKEYEAPSTPLPSDNNDTTNQTEVDDLTLDIEGDNLYDFVVDENSVWELWGNVFEQLAKDGDLHEWSLEKLNIIQCGNKIACRPPLPSELYDMLNDPHFLISPFKPCHHRYICDVFDAPDALSMLEKIRLSPSPDEELLFINELLSIFVKTIFTGKNVTNSENNFSFRIIWPLMELAANADIIFECGEYTLNSMKAEYCRRSNDFDSLKKNQYKADGCFLYHDIEIGLLEVSGSYGNTDIRRHTKDHIKAGFGILSMLNNLAYKYQYGSFEAYSNIRLFFIHAKDKKLRVWSFEMASPGIYVMNMIDHACLPSDLEDCERDLRHLASVLWTLKHLLQYTVECIKRLKESHVQTSKSISRGLIPEVKVTTLPNHLKFHRVLKLNVSYIPDSDDLIMNSSPLGADDLSVSD